jgi:type I restriction enzyme S subunit
MSAVVSKKKRERQSVTQAPARHSGEDRNPPTSSFRTPRSGDPESSFLVSLETVAFAPLGEVADINPRFDRDELAGDMLASFVPMKCVEEESGQFVPLEDRKVGDVRKGYTAFRDGDVIFAKVTPCMENGKAAVISGLTNSIGFGSTEFFVLRPSERIDSKYLLHFVLQQSFRKEAARNMTGAVGLRRVPKSWLEQQRIPLPSIAAQRQIVAEIEKQFTRLDAGVAALRRVQANLKRYRAAVLNAACEGRLVPTEAELARAESRTYETGEQLLARILADRRKNWHGRGKYKEPAAPDTTSLPPLPEGWAWTVLDGVTEIIDPNPSHRMPKYVADGIPLISSENFVGNEKIDFNIGKRVSRETLELQRSRYFIQSGDFALSRIGTIGKTRFLPTDREYCLSHALVVISVRSNDVSRRWLKQTIASEALTLQARRGVQSVGVPDLGMAKIRGLVIALPPLSEQIRILAEVERRLSVIEELEAAVTANLQRTTRLRQSILQRAFAASMQMQ